MIVSIWRNFWCLSAGKKSISSFTFSLRYYKNIANLLFWVLWVCLTLHIQWYYQLVEKFCVHPQAKNQLHSPCFFEDAAKIGKLLIWVLWACLAMHTQNGTIKLSKTSMFICTPKIHFIIHFLLEILDFKEPSNLIGWQYFGPLTREPEYCQIWDWWWIINSNVSFQF